MQGESRRGRPDHELTEKIIGACYYVYNALGFGFLESTYSKALVRVLRRAGHEVACEVRVPIYFEGEVLAYHRIDILVDRRVIVEIKAVEVLHPNALRQLVHYLKATNLEVGLLLHFSPDGAVVKRRVNTPRAVHRRNPRDP